MRARREVRDSDHGTQYCYGTLGCRCKPCTKANSVAVMLRKQSKRDKQLKLSVTPLLEYMPEEFFENHKRAIEVWEQKGLTVFEADRICTRYGVHPFAVYGTQWYSDMWAEVA